MQRLAPLEPRRLHLIRALGALAPDVKSAATWQTHMPLLISEHSVSELGWNTDVGTITAKGLAGGQIVG